MKEYYIYSDESRQKNERFLLLAGLWIEPSNLKTLESQISAIRSRYGYINDSKVHVDFLGEFKWTKVSTRYLNVYQEVIDTFFSWLDDGLARFCCLLVDTHNQVVMDYSNLKKEGYFKFLYQLYFQNSKTPGVYTIFPDKITNPKQAKVNFKTLDTCLESGFKKKFIPLLNPTEIIPRSGFVANITPTDSKNSQFIQVVDIVMGALGYLQNHHYEKPEAKEAKISLMKYLISKLVLNGAIKIEGKKFLIAKSNKFNIWLFKPKNHR